MFSLVSSPISRYGRFPSWVPCAAYYRFKCCRSEQPGSSGVPQLHPKPHEKVQIKWVKHSGMVWLWKTMEVFSRHLICGGWEPREAFDNFVSEISCFRPLVRPAHARPNPSLLADTLFTNNQKPEGAVLFLTHHLAALHSMLLLP